MTYSIKRGLAAAGAVLMLCAMGGCGRDPQEKPSSEASNALTTTQPTEKAADTPTEGNTTAGTSASAMGTATPGQDNPVVIDWDDLFGEGDATATGTATAGTGASSAGTTKAGAGTSATGKTGTTAAHGDIAVGEDTDGGQWGLLKE